MNVSAYGFTSQTNVTLTVAGNMNLNVDLVAQVVTPPAVAGLSNVTFLVTDNGQPVVGAKIDVWLEDENPMIDGYLMSRAIHRGVTNASGQALLVMMQKASFTKGGTYLVRVVDVEGRTVHHRRVTVPTVSNLFAEDLVDA